MKNTYLLFFSFLLFGSLLKGQDAHFSQFYAVPYNVNPAMTGALNGTYRLIANYRDQWSGALNNPYTTLAMGGDVNFNIGKPSMQSRDKFGVGLLFVSDRVDILHFNTNEIALFGAYHKALDKRGNHTLGIGVKTSVIQKNVNYDNINFGDSFNNVDGFTLPTQENLPPNNFGFADLSLGLNYNFSLSDASRFYAGVASHHLTTPNVSFYPNILNPSPDLILDNQLDFRNVFHLSLDQEMTEFWSLQPRLIYQSQGPHQEVNLGTNLKYNFLQVDRSVYFGAWIRTVKNLDGIAMESIIPLMGIQYGSFLLGISYDINLSQSTAGVAGFNAFEISIRFIGEHDNEGAYCPQF